MLRILYQILERKTQKPSPGSVPTSDRRPGPLPARLAQGGAPSRDRSGATSSVKNLLEGTLTNLGRTFLSSVQFIKKKRVLNLNYEFCSINHTLSVSQKTQSLFPN